MYRAISVNPLQFNQTLNKTYDCKYQESIIYTQINQITTICYKTMTFVQITAPITSAIDAGWKVTAEDVGMLKKTLVQVFTETFCKQLIGPHKIKHQPIKVLSKLCSGASNI